MMDWSDKHCRFFFRMMSQGAVLYTEMVTTGAILFGNKERHLDFNDEEHPVALQLGGSDPSDLGQCARLAEDWGYDEINLNCGCPSERVKKGNFGASLMLDPKLVANCFSQMSERSSLPVTIKHRLGVDQQESYGFVSDFVGALENVGCRTFIVHARTAILKGLSPKDNREIPPLRYQDVEKLKKDFPNCSFILNGGITSSGELSYATDKLDGAMIGRAAYHNPDFLQFADQILFENKPRDTEEIIEKISEYAGKEIKKGVPLRCITRHLLGLFKGKPGAKLWRQRLSDSAQLEKNKTTFIRDTYTSLRASLSSS
jgi:tRNA-dihydrouridine synthase A